MTFTVGKHPGPPALSFLAGPKSGPPLLLLHGLGRFSEDFSTLAATLARDWHVVALDFRGHGHSDRTPGEYRVVHYVADTVGFIRQQFAEPLVVYGHSLGAMVALAVAASLPQQVRGIILEEPPFHTMGRRIEGSAWASLFSGMQRVSRRGQAIEVMAEELAGIQLPSRDGAGPLRLGDVRSRDALRFSARCLSMIDPDVFSSPIEGRWLDDFNERELFARVNCPVLLLQGDPAMGGALTDEDADRAEASLRNCRRLRFTGAGHLIRSEKLDEVMRAVVDFGRKLASLVPKTPFPGFALPPPPC
jgi:pimeloyl-ACP methyl ester carboxylesterase